MIRENNLRLTLYCWKYMYQSILHITTLSLILFGNAISLSMEVIDAPQFYTQQLSEDLQRHIFVVAHPPIKNQLKICSKSWHAIGTKKSPNMYQLVNNPSFRASHDDWCYIMMHASLDKNWGVMRTVLDRTDHRDFDYDIGVDYFRYVHSKTIRYWFCCDMYDLSKSGNSIYEEFKELGLVSNIYRYQINPLSLFKACFDGDIDTVEKLKKTDKSARHLHHCIVIAVYNDNPYCIEMLSSEVSDIVHDQLHLDLLRLAMRNNKKRAFKALVENNVYGRLNDPVGIHPGSNTTTLDELLEQKDIPNLQEYIDLYKQLGGRTWQEVKYEEEANKSQLAFMTFCPIQ